MLKPEPKMIRHQGQLNGSQQRGLLVTCSHIDKSLCDIERALHSATSESPFPRYVVDVTPAQSRAIEGYIHRLRSQLLRTLDWQHMKPEPASVPVTRSMISQLTFIDIAIEELKPRHMRGYGAIPEDAVDGLNGVVGELQSIVGSMERYLRQELAAPSGSGPEQMGEAGHDAARFYRLVECQTKQRRSRSRK